MKPISKKISEKTLEEMCTDKFKRDFTNMLRSRYPLFYITHNEEPRLIRFLDHYCRVKGYECFCWDACNGLSSLASGNEVGGTSEDLKNNPIAILDYIKGEAKAYEKKKTSVKEKKDKNVNGILYVLLDYYHFIQPNPDVERRLKDLANLSSIVTTIFTGPFYQATDVTENILPVIDFPLANKKEIRHALHDVVRGAESRIPDIVNKTKGMEEELINAVTGLTLQEAQTALSKSLVDDHKWDIDLILEEKQQIIKKSGNLEYFNSPVSMDDVGGLKNLTRWIGERKKGFSEEAAAYGLKKPRGLLTIGMPGCVTSETKIKIKKISKKGNLKIYEK